MRCRRLIFLPAFLVLLTAAQPALGPGDAARYIVQNSFGRGETINYKVHYGLLNAADATVETSGNLERINNRPCYKATVSGRTTGSFDFFLRIRDQWRAYIDTTSILPLRAQREIAEKNYRKKEVIDFDHERDVAEVFDVRDNKRSTVKVANHCLELVSGFYYLRTLNFERMRVGESLRMPAYFDGDNFLLEVVFKGRQTVETKAGTIRTFKLVPKMPDNKLFRGENAISVYFSDDRNKIPVLFQAEMFVGSIKVDMCGYQGLKGALNKVN